MIAVNGLAGLALAPNALMATVPVTSYVIGSALASAPIAKMMKTYGRRVGFSVGTLFGVLGVLTAALGNPLVSELLAQLPPEPGASRNSDNGSVVKSGGIATSLP